MGRARSALAHAPMCFKTSVASVASGGVGHSREAVVSSAQDSVQAWPAVRRAACLQVEHGGP
jgi:hypothetical protein